MVRYREIRAWVKTVYPPKGMGCDIHRYQKKEYDPMYGCLACPLCTKERHDFNARQWAHTMEMEGEI